MIKYLLIALMLTGCSPAERYSNEGGSKNVDLTDANNLKRCADLCYNLDEKLVSVYHGWAKSVVDCLCSDGSEHRITRNTWIAPREKNNE